MIVHQEAIDTIIPDQDLISIGSRSLEFSDSSTCERSLSNCAILCGWQGDIDRLAIDRYLSILTVGDNSTGHHRLIIGFLQPRSNQMHQII
jgi:hypothetical protein